MITKMVAVHGMSKLKSQSLLDLSIFKSFSGMKEHPVGVCVLIGFKIIYP